MKLYNFCFWLFMVCSVFYLGFASASALAQEAPAATKAVTASADPAPTPVVVEKGGIFVQNKSPINVEVNVPEQDPPKVENNIDIPDEFSITRADMGFCEKNPMTCALTGVAVVAAGLFVADQLGAFDSTNTVEFTR